jgi:hypothetical protein
MLNFISNLRYSRSCNAKEDALFAVSDTGVGLASKAVESVFRPPCSATAEMVGASSSFCWGELARYPSSQQLIKTSTLA